MRSVSKGTVEARGKGRWRLRLNVVDDMGKSMRIDRPVECRTKTQAKLELEAWRMELMAPSRTTLASRGGTSLHDYLEDYIRYCHDVKGLSPNTIRGYRDIVRNRWDPRLANVRLRDLTPAAIDEQVTWLRTRGSTAHGPLSGKTVREALGFLSTALDRAERLGHISTNPCRRVEPVHCGKREEVTAMDEDEVKRMKTVVLGHPDYRFAMAVCLALDTGMRRGEICALQWRDVDLDNARLHVTRSMAEGGRQDTYNGRTLQEKDPKSRRSRRFISLPATTVGRLRGHLETQYHRLAYNGIEQTADTPVFCDAFGEPYRPSKLTSDFTAFARQHNFEVTFHGLRHTHASLLLRQGMSIAHVSQRLGHESIEVTYRFYSHFMPQDDGGAAEAWEAATEPGQTNVVSFALPDPS